MSQADRAKWDARYDGPTYRMGAGPKAFLVEVAPLLPLAGLAVDLAAGEGQNAVYLARRGLDVLALDISEVGLAKARELAEASGVNLHTQAVDLTEDPIPLAPSSCQLITCFHYLQRDLIPLIFKALAPGGVVVLEYCGVPNLTRHPHPSRRYLVEPGELATWFPSCELLHLEEGWRGDVFVCRLVAQRP